MLRKSKKVNSTDIMISSNRSNAPIYWVNDMIVTVDWSKKKIDYDKNINQWNN